MDHSDELADLQDETTKISPPPSLQRKRNIRGDILNLLSESRYGLNIKQISKTLKLSRNTVKSYLSHFEKENLIKVKEIGRAKICFLNEFPEKGGRNPLELLFPTFFKNFLTAFTTITSESLLNPQEIMKKIGKEMAPFTIWPTGRLIPIPPKLKSPISLDQIKLIALQFIDLLNSFGPVLHVELDESSIFKKDHAAILKIRDVRQSDLNNCYYYLWAGILETKLREAFGTSVYLTIREIETETSSYYFELGIYEKN